MRLPAFDAHRAARVADQGRTFWLLEIPCLAVIALALAAAWIA